MDIKKGNGFVHLILSRELDTRVDLIETIVKLGGRVCDLGCRAPQARSTVGDEAENVIHINLNETGNDQAACLGGLNGSLQSP